MKTLRIFAALFALLLTSPIYAQEKTEVRNVTGYSEVSVSEGIHVELTFGKEEFVEVTADTDIIDQVLTELSGERLNIYIKGNLFKNWNNRVLVKVTAKKVNAIDVSSGASLVSQNLIESNELKMSTSSGANLKVAFKAPIASCNASSGAHATLKGIAKFFKTDASSGAGIKASEVKGIKVKAQVSSGANISINAEEELEASASSGGSIKYTGTPKMIDINSSSGGSIHKKE